VYFVIMPFSSAGAFQVTLIRGLVFWLGLIKVNLRFCGALGATVWEGEQTTTKQNKIRK